MVKLGEVKNVKYQVICNNLIQYYGIENEYETGEFVTMHIPFLRDVNTAILSDDVELQRDSDDCSYIVSFVMPEKDVTVVVKNYGSMQMNMSGFVNNSMNFQTMGNMSMNNGMNTFIEVKQEKTESDDGEKLICADCGWANKSSSRFCYNCGSVLKKQN